jgi:hypothetical protein
VTDQTGDDVVSRRRLAWWLGGGSVLVIAAVVAAAAVWGSGTTPLPVGPTPHAESSTASPSPAAGSSTPAPAASSSSAEDPKTTEPRPTASPIGLDESAEPAEGVRVRLAKITAIKGTASVPGEVAGPALQVMVDVDNLSTHDALTDTMIVNVYYGAKRMPANILVTPRRDLPISIAPGKSATGIYAFSVPEGARDQIVVEVDLSLALPVIIFEGAVS